MCLFNEVFYYTVLASLKRNYEQQTVDNRTRLEETITTGGGGCGISVSADAGRAGWVLNATCTLGHRSTSNKVDVGTYMPVICVQKIWLLI